MSLRLNKSCFVHIPRTGGIWLQEVAHKLGILRQVLKGDVDSHFSYKQLPEEWQQLKSFTFLRNPYDWVKSRWSHAILIRAYDDMRHYGVHRDFDKLVRTSFLDTLKNIIEHRKKNGVGLVERTYTIMSAGVRHKIKTENITEKVSDYLFSVEGCKLLDIKKAIEATNSETNTSAKLSKFKSHFENIPEDLLEEFKDCESTAYKMWDSAI